MMQTFKLISVLSLTALLLSGICTQTNNTPPIEMLSVSVFGYSATAANPPLNNASVKLYRNNTLINTYPTGAIGSTQAFAVNPNDRLEISYSGKENKTLHLEKIDGVNRIQVYMHDDTNFASGSAFGRVAKASGASVGTMQILHLNNLTETAVANPISGTYSLNITLSTHPNIRLGYIVGVDTVKIAQSPGKGSGGKIDVFFDETILGGN